MLLIELMLTLVRLHLSSWQCCFQLERSVPTALCRMTVLSSWPACSYARLEDYAVVLPPDCPCHRNPCSLARDQSHIMPDVVHRYGCCLCGACSYLLCQCFCCCTLCEQVVTRLYSLSSAHYKVCNGRPLFLL
jgi:hypothetical protein